MGGDRVAVDRLRARRWRERVRLLGSRPLASYAPSSCVRQPSFSSSVFARLRGGSVVLGSGSSCPHDFLFFAGLLWMMTGGGEVCVDVPHGSSNAAGDGDEPLCKSSILRYWGGEGDMKSSSWWSGVAKWC
jgi:hypothetical protein